MNSKHDLSFQSTKIDYPTIKEVVGNAMFLARGQVERNLSAMQNASLKSDMAQVKYSAQYLLEAAIVLAKAADTYYVLTESEKREKFEVINR